MTRTLTLSLSTLALAWAFVSYSVQAAPDAELRKKQQQAQKERQAQTRQRSTDLREARRSYSAAVADLKREYQEKLRGLDTGFDLKRVEIEADRDKKIAVAEAEYQKKISQLLKQPGMGFDTAGLKKLQNESKLYSDELFQVKKQFAGQSHAEKMALEKQKHALLAERDRRAIEEAAKLGLTKDHQPVLASPIGGELTVAEKRWNEREEKEVSRINEQNRRMLGEFETAARLREWEMKNLQADFELAWREKAEQHELNAQQMFASTFLTQAAQPGQTAPQDFMSQIAELTKQQELLRIKYDTIRKQNAIHRREEKRQIQGR